jgi:hypothetical protein
MAYLPNASFDLLISERLGGLGDTDRVQFRRALETWLLAGSLGLRATRGGGAFRWDDAPDNSDTFRESLGKLLAGSRLSFDLLAETFKDPETARKVITETISHQAFAAENYPLGGINLGDLRRKTSPLRLTVRCFADGYRILALWDGRDVVSGNTRNHLRSAIEKLANGTANSNPTKIGKLLAQSALAR